MLDALLSDVRYVPGAFDDDGVYSRLARTLAELDERAGRALNRVFYLSTAPQFFPLISGKLGAARLDRSERAQTRIVIEKPFGYDLASARKLNAQVLGVFDESQVFRIDHYLGKETVQNLIALRFANALFEPVWNRNFIDHVQITVAEDLGIGARAGYYEGAGALRDLVQNHMLELLALLTMEPPSSFEANRLRDEKLKVLEAIAPPTVDEVHKVAIRAQYRAGVVGGAAVPSYVEEAGVAPDSRTETYAALRLNVSQLALVRRPVLPADRKEPSAQADRDRGNAQAGAAPGVSEHRLGRRAGQPDHPDGAARRGAVGLTRGEDPRPSHADPSGEHGFSLRHGVPLRIPRGV